MSKFDADVMVYALQRACKEILSCSYRDMLEFAQRFLVNIALG